MLIKKEKEKASIRESSMAEQNLVVKKKYYEGDRKGIQIQNTTIGPWKNRKEKI